MKNNVIGKPANPEMRSVADSRPKDKPVQKARTGTKAKTLLKAVPQAKIESQPTIQPVVASSWAGRVPQVKPGTYADGLPFHQVEYLCCKMMLRPNHFT